MSAQPRPMLVTPQSGVTAPCRPHAAGPGDVAKQRAQGLLKFRNRGAAHNDASLGRYCFRCTTGVARNDRQPRRLCF